MSAPEVPSAPAAPRYLNRELSWLEFNQRVLDEAVDESNPLLERLRFLAITASNLDEFFMVRVGGLHLLQGQGGTKPDPTGLSPHEQLALIGVRTRRMIDDQYACFMQTLEPRLAGEGLKRGRPGQLTERQWKGVDQLFDQEIFALLTPQAVASPAEFPLLGNQTLNVCVRLKPPVPGDPPRFAIIPIGRSANRFRTLHAEGGHSYILLEDIITLFVSRYFPGETVAECVPFRITRNADLTLTDDAAADLREEMQEILEARKESACVRLEIAAAVSDVTLAFLREALRVQEEHVFRAPGPLDLAAFMQLVDLPGFDRLRNEPWPPQPTPDVAPTEGTIFEVIADHDVLLFHPYESFEPVVRMIEEAADDPDVLAIKQILYRTSRNSPIVAALRRAAEKGKHVTALVELKARFDEARNIEWARRLEQSGVQVIYGVKGLKTHAKLCIIVRREPHRIQRYVHFGTGNYNETTARLYSDVSLITANEELGSDATSFFNAISGHSQPQHFRKLEAAPLGLRERLLEMIDAERRLQLERQLRLTGRGKEPGREVREARHEPAERPADRPGPRDVTTLRAASAEDGRPGKRKPVAKRPHIIVKLNSLVDTEIIEALYAASQVGVVIHLNVRGTCCLRPGVPGLSDNITVVSVVDRFLEHARILYFHHGGDERVFISSADWMPRNLDRRVELLVPIEDFGAKQRLIGLLGTYFRDTVHAHRLLPDGSYERLQAAGRRKRVRCQEEFFQQACKAVKQAELSRRAVFEPHRNPDAANPTR